MPSIKPSDRNIYMLPGVAAQPDRLPTAADPHDGGGEPPHNGGMDLTQRVDRIDIRLEHIEGDVKQTKWLVVGSAVSIVLAMVGTVIGTGVAIQQMTVATFQAASPQPQQLPTAPPTVIVVPAQQGQPAK